jgi:hypothetical protein
MVGQLMLWSGESGRLTSLSDLGKRTRGEGEETMMTAVTRTLLGLFGHDVWFQPPQNLNFLSESKFKVLREQHAQLQIVCEMSVDLSFIVNF